MNIDLKIKYLTLGIFLTAASSCRTQRPPQPLPALPDNFTHSGKASVPQKWWTVFEDKDLNELIDKALKNNFDIKTAWMRLAEAKALLNREESNLQPDVDLSAGAGDRRGGELGNKERSEYSIGLEASYEIDLWGRIKSQTEAERFRLKATYAELQTAALSLSSEITRTWMQIIEAEEQIKIIRLQIETNKKSLMLLENRFKGGQIRQADVLRQKQLIKSDFEKIITIESRIETLKHSLAVLLGEAPQDIKIDSDNKTLPDIPSLPNTGIPAELVQRRPDIIYSLNLIHAANQDLAVAVTEQYPRITLGAAISTLSGDPAELFRQWVRSVSASLIAPLEDGGERKAEIKRNEAIEKRRVNEYSQAVLKAFQEVEDALIREKKQLEKIKNLEEQQELSKQTYELLEAQYFNGDGNFLDMLSATVNLQGISRQILSAKLVLLEYRIALYRALAGGIELKEEL